MSSTTDNDHNSRNGIIALIIGAVIVTGFFGAVQAITFAQPTGTGAGAGSAVSNLSNKGSFVGNVATFLGKEILIVIATPNAPNGTNASSVTPLGNTSIVVQPKNGTEGNSTGVVITPIQANTTVVISTDKNGTQTQTFPTSNVTTTPSGDVVVNTGNETQNKTASMSSNMSMSMSGNKTAEQPKANATVPIVPPNVCPPNICGTAPAGNGNVSGPTVTVQNPPVNPAPAPAMGNMASSTPMKMGSMTAAPKMGSMSSAPAPAPTKAMGTMSTPMKMGTMSSAPVPAKSSGPVMGTMSAGTGNHQAQQCGQILPVPFQALMSHGYTGNSNPYWHHTHTHHHHHPQHHHHRH